MDLDKSLWGLINQYMGEDEILSGAELHQGAVSRLTIAISEIMYVLGEQRESGVQFLADIASEVGHLLEMRGGHSEEERKALETLEKTLGDILGFNSENAVQMFSTTASVQNKFEMLCLSRQIEPSELFKQMVENESLSLYGSKEEDC